LACTGIGLSRVGRCQDRRFGRGDIAPSNSSAAYRATGSEAWSPHIVAHLAEACQIAGQVEEALSLLDEALQIAEETGERWFAAELNRQSRIAHEARTGSSRDCHPSLAAIRLRPG